MMSGLFGSDLLGGLEHLLDHLFRVLEDRLLGEREVLRLQLLVLSVLQIETELDVRFQFVLIAWRDVVDVHDTLAGRMQLGSDGQLSLPAGVERLLERL